MPVFATFAGIFALSSLAFPGTNSFIGEFLVLTGGFKEFLLLNTGKISTALMICVVPGVVLAAAYMLRMLQRIAYGGTRNPDHSKIPDLGLREVVCLAPLLVLVFWIGLKPEPFTRIMRVSVERVVQQGRAGLEDAAVAGKAEAKPSLAAVHPDEGFSR